MSRHGKKEQTSPKEQQIKDAFYWYVSDYSDLLLPWRIREGLDPKLSFAKDIIMESDLNDLSYLYEFGEYISESELKLAAFMNTLPQETVDKMADTYTEGYRKGFSVMGRDITKKKTVVVEYQLGFERMIREAVEEFPENGTGTDLLSGCGRVLKPQTKRQNEAILVLLPTSSMIMITAMTAPFIWEMPLKRENFLF